MIEHLDINEATGVAVAAAKRAGMIHQRYRGMALRAQRKERFDISTEVDVLAEREIVKLLRAKYPDHRLRSEESVDRGQQPEPGTDRWTWIIDPLDGTINYVAGWNFYSVSLALQYEDQTVLGVVYSPSTKELFTGIRGAGAYLNGERILASTQDQLQDSVVSIMLTSHYTKEETERVLKLAEALALNTRGLRLLVSQALELAYIASGKLQAHVCVKSRGFSAAAGSLLVKEAGGQVTDIAGKEFGDNSKSLVATNGFLHEKLLTLLACG